MKVKIVITAIVLVLLTPISFAQGFGFRVPPIDRDWPMGFQRLHEDYKSLLEDYTRLYWKFKEFPRLYEELKLTDDQRAKLEKLFFEFRKNQADIAGKLNKARIELQELLSAEKPDKSAIDKKVNEVSDYMKELFKNRTNYWLDVQQILTPEQRKILKDKFGRFGLGLGRWGKPGRGLRLHCW